MYYKHTLCVIIRQSKGSEPGNRPLTLKGIPMQQSLLVRQTHKFVGTYKDLDKWDHIGEFDIEAISDPIVNMDDPEDPCETTARILFIRVMPDSPARKQSEIERALRDGFESHGCGHDFDCCGCWSTSVIKVERLNDDYWRVETSASRNY